MGKEETLTKQEKRTRSGIYFYAWKKHKKDLTMTSLARILKTSVANFYQIVKKREKVDKKKLIKRR